MSDDDVYETKSEIEKRREHTKIEKEAFRNTMDKIANSGIIYHYDLNESEEFDKRLLHYQWFNTIYGFIKVEKKKENKYRIYYIDDKNKNRYHTFSYYKLIAHYNPTPAEPPINAYLYKKNRNFFTNKKSVKFQHGHVSIGGKRKSARMTKRRKSRKNKKTNKRRN